MVAVQVKVGTAAGVFSYPLTDHLGNVVALSTTGGALVAGSVARYDPFGNFRTLPTTNPGTTSHGFTGHRHNNTGAYPTLNVGLIYMNARYYLPEVGRFISPDTIVPEPGNPQSFNRYTYALNSPTNFTDPSGHAECASENCDLFWHPTSGNVVVRNTSSPLYGLIQMFSTSSASAQSQLEQIVAETNTKFMSFTFRILGQFSGLGDAKGDAGFSPELRDDHLYEGMWGMDSPASRQVGHFLSAVAMGYDRGVKQWLWLYLIVRHEQFADGNGGIGRYASLVRQAVPAAPYELPTAVGHMGNFLDAAGYDLSGDFAARDGALGNILSPEFYGAQEGRLGNSMEDLRLSVRGWNLGTLAADGQFGSSRDIANWMALYVAGG